MCFSVFVYFIKQFVGIALCFFGYSFAGLLFQIGICFNVRTVYKDSFRVQIAFIRGCFQHPTENILNRCCIEPVLEVIAYG